MSEILKYLNIELYAPKMNNNTIDKSAKRKCEAEVK